MKHESDFALIDAPAAHGELLHAGTSRRYLLVSPCRDEAQYLRRTLDSVAAQSVPPALWVVVDGFCCAQAAVPARTERATSIAAPTDRIPLSIVVSVVIEHRRTSRRSW